MATANILVCRRVYEMSLSMDKLGNSFMVYYQLI